MLYYSQNDLNGFSRDAINAEGELVLDGRVNKADIDAWAIQGGINHALYHPTEKGEWNIWGVLAPNVDN